MPSADNNPISRNRVQLIHGLQYDTFIYFLVTLAWYRYFIPKVLHCTHVAVPNELARNVLLIIRFLLLKRAIGLETIEKTIMLKVCLGWSKTWSCVDLFPMSW
jgi:hypothetical protein